MVMLPSYQAVLATAVSAVALASTVIAATLYGVDTRVGIALAPLRGDIAVLQSQRASDLRVLEDIRSDVRWLMQQEIAKR